MTGSPSRRRRLIWLLGVPVVVAATVGIAGWATWRVDERICCRCGRIETDVRCMGMLLHTSASGRYAALRAKHLENGACPDGEHLWADLRGTSAALLAMFYERTAARLVPGIGDPDVTQEFFGIAERLAVRTRSESPAEPKRLEAMLTFHKQCDLLLYHKGHARKGVLAGELHRMLDNWSRYLAESEQGRDADFPKDPSYAWQEGASP